MTQTALFVGTVGDPEPGRALDAPIVRTLWLTPDEIRANAARHRSPLLLACIGISYQTGKNDGFRSGSEWALVQADRASALLNLSYAVSPSLVHATVMTFGFIPLFFSGFLFTAGPKWLGVPAPRPVAVVLTDSFPVTAPTLDQDSMVRLALEVNPTLMALRARGLAASSASPAFRAPPTRRRLGVNAISTGIRRFAAGGVAVASFNVRCMRSCRPFCSGCPARIRSGCMPSFIQPTESRDSPAMARPCGFAWTL